MPLSLVVQIIGIAISNSKLAMITLKERSGLGNSLERYKLFPLRFTKAWKVFSCNAAGSSELNLQRSLLKRHFTYWSFVHLTSKNSGCWHSCFIQLLYFVFCKEKGAPVSTARLSLRVGGRVFPAAYMTMTSWLLSLETKEKRIKSKQGCHSRAGVRRRWFLPANTIMTTWLLSQRKQWKIQLKVSSRAVI